MAVERLTPNTVKSAVNYNFVGSSVLAQGIHKPQVGNEVVQRYGRQDITGMVEMLGNKEVVKSLEYTHYEKDFIHSVLQFDASTGTAASKTLTVASGYGFDIEEDNSPYIATGSSTAYAPRQYDVIEFPNGVEAMVTAVSGADITVVPTQTGTAIPAVGVNDEIVIKGNAVKEGSSPVQGRQSRLLDYVNNTQIFRDDLEITNTEAGQETWFEVKGRNGETGYLWTLEAINDMYHRFLNEREVQFLTGKKITNTALANTTGFETVIKTEGIIPQIESGGNVETYTSGGMTRADFENMTVDLDKFKGSTENMIACGFDFRQDVNTLFSGEVTSGGFDAAKAGGIVFHKFDGMGDGKVNFDFDAFKINGYRFAIKPMQVFSDVNLLGAAGHKYRGIGIVIPLDDTAVYNNQNAAASSAMVPSITLMCGEDRQGSREMREWVTGYGAGNVPTTGDDKHQYHILSHCGIRMAALNRFGIFKEA